MKVVKQRHTEQNSVLRLRTSKKEFNLNCILRIWQYRAVNAKGRGNNDQPVNDMSGNNRCFLGLTEIVRKCSSSAECRNSKCQARQYTFYPLGFEGCVVRAEADPYKFSETRHFLTLAPLCVIAAGKIISSIQVFQGRKFCPYAYNVVKNQ